ncbi:hypothetical protein QT384_01355 [Arcobacter cryaerophilus gv. pseudocryaerophilus]|uniref:Uncharacterized protein n=3 Tax=Arcobacteraceae TaxID=2808963 RepID=A0AA96IIX7_9BACT|nr:hypothetical protein RMP68_00315 [Arcobacter sp. AZ-2023]WNL36456.1 hypothetical protein RMQ66_01355 [Arcobacter sp. AZ-2023]WPD12172.1 hypothetical protein QT384_01355 [Arcobacter sp. DSM 115960]
MSLEIKTVKIQGEGYFVNNKLFVPKSEGNKDYEILKVWLKKNTPESEFSNEDLEKTRVQNINSYTQSFIYSKYPQPKQSSANLGVYDEVYKNEIVAFIKRVVDLSNQAIDKGTSLEDYKVILENNK